MIIKNVCEITNNGICDFLLIVSKKEPMVSYVHSAIKKAVRFSKLVCNVCVKEMSFSNLDL